MALAPIRSSARRRARSCLKCSSITLATRSLSSLPSRPDGTNSGSSHFASLEQHVLEAPTIASQLSSRGFAPTSHRLLTKSTCDQVRDRLPKLFRGEFETGIYPDEWHWREGISKDNAAREICNAWKADRTIASIVLNKDLGRLVADVMGWDSVRIGQDDLVWKPPSQRGPPKKMNRIDTVGFHQDSAYISTRFEPYENNSVTLWMALDDADDENGCIEYAVGSHKWRPLLHRAEGAEAEKEGATSGGESEISSFHSADATSYRNSVSDAATLAECDNPLEVIESVPVKEGHAIFHHQDVWHGSGPNISARHRRALVAHCLRGDVSFVESRNFKDKQNGPFGNSSYIYGRYKRHNSADIDESFFPIIFGREGSNLSRTVWIDEYTSKC